MSTDNSAASDIEFDAEQLEDLYQDCEETIASLDEDLEKFLRRHPSFGDRVGIYISSRKPDPSVSGESLRPATDGELNSEWDALVAFGYKLAHEEMLRQLRTGRGILTQDQ